MKPLITIAASLLIAAPAAAQSFRPDVAGPVFCDLIRQGVNPELAVRHVIQMTWDDRRRVTYVIADNKRQRSDVAGLVSYIKWHCAGGLY